MREKEGLANTEYISKERAQKFLKKNLAKLLVLEDPATVEHNEEVQKHIQKLEQAKES